ncbi:hypothetical protein EBR57_04330 [bacterium]|nr:hypothetical protein [bacterium]
MGTVAIFGGTGASGRKVVRELLDRGYRARLLVRTPAAAADWAHDWVSPWVTAASLCAYGIGNGPL